MNETGRYVFVKNPKVNRLFVCRRGSLSTTSLRRNESSETSTLPQATSTLTVDEAMGVHPVNTIQYSDDIRAGSSDFVELDSNSGKQNDLLVLYSGSVSVIVMIIVVVYTEDLTPPMWWLPCRCCTLP